MTLFFVEKSPQYSGRIWLLFLHHLNSEFYTKNSALKIPLQFLLISILDLCTKLIKIILSWNSKKERTLLSLEISEKM